jgi:hypothetical protein
MLKGRARISKKVTSRSGIKEKATTEEKVNIITELWQKYPLKLLLKLSKVSESNYYYTKNKVDKDFKNDQIRNEIIDIFYLHKQWYG